METTERSSQRSGSEVGAYRDAKDELFLLARARGPLRDMLAMLSARFVSLEGWSRLGYARPGDYARERLGASARSLQDWARVGTRLEALPELRAALVGGRLPWSKVRLLARFVEPEDEAGWIAHAERRSMQELEREVRAVDRGALEAGAAPGPAPATTGAENETSWLRISAHRSLAFKWQRTKHQASRIEGADLSPGEVLERVTAEVLAALPVRLEEAAHAEDDQAADIECGATRTSAGPMNDDRAWTPTRVGTDLHGSLASSRAPAPSSPPAFLARLLEGLDDADAFELDARLRRVIRLEQRLDAQIASLARIVTAPDYEWRDERPTKAQLASELLGISASKLRALLRIERVGDVCPAMLGAYRDGELSWVQADALAPLLESDAEGDPRREWRAEWVAYAKDVSGLRLKQAVARARFLHDASPEEFELHREDPAWFGSMKPTDVGDESRDRQKCARPMDPTERVRITFRAASDVAQLFRAVLCTLRRAIERDTGRLPDEAEAFETMLGHALDCWNVDDPWLKRNMSRKYRAVLDRDDWKCVFPGCTSRKNLHVHHIRFRSAGGGDEPENLTTLCAFHHLRGVHGGTASLSGVAPDRLDFAIGLRAGREPLARYRSGGRVVV